MFVVIVAIRFPVESPGEPSGPNRRVLETSPERIRGSARRPIFPSCESRYDCYKPQIGFFPISVRSEDWNRQLPC